LRDCFSPSARPELLELRPSRALLAWWVALHVVLGLAAVLVNLPIGLAGLPVLALHARLKNPVRGGLIVIGPGGRFALPSAGRFNLSLAPSTRYGPGWAELVFSDRPRARLLVLRDQLDAQGWRRLRLTLGEAG